jgi:hypothetical protein
MKKNLVILFLCLFSLNAFAQNKEEHDKKIKALKIAFITENLDLTNTEAQKFWPIYNTFEEQISALRDESYEKRKTIDYTNLTENQAKQIIADFKNTNAERTRLYDTFISDLLKIISAKKVVLLKKTEDDFKRKMFEEYRNRRKNSPKGDHP